MDLERQFLNNLAGRWMLTGKMGKVDLQQEVLARWILNDTFLWMNCTSNAPESNPTADYEAIYHLGFNTEHRLFIMHLLDTTEVPIDCTVGRGVLENNRIVFRFDYEDKPFLYEFAWDGREHSWDLLQTYEQDGSVETFASKRLIPA